MERNPTTLVQAEKSPQIHTWRTSWRDRDFNASKWHQRNLQRIASVVHTLYVLFKAKAEIRSCLQSFNNFSPRNPETKRFLCVFSEQTCCLTKTCRSHGWWMSKKHHLRTAWSSPFVGCSMADLLWSMKRQRPASSSNYPGPVSAKWRWADLQGQASEHIEVHSNNWGGLKMIHVRNVVHTLHVKWMNRLTMDRGFTWSRMIWPQLTKEISITTVSRAKKKTLCCGWWLAFRFIFHSLR